MLDQLKLFGSDAEPPGIDHSSRAKKPGARRQRYKLFYAILLDAATAREFSRLGMWLNQHYGIAGNLLREDRLHITLHVLGEYDEYPSEEIEMAKRIGARVNAASFDVAFDHAMTFKTSSNPYVLRVSEDADKAIRDFWLTLGMEIANVYPFKKPSFTPHMTMSYKGNVIAPHPIEPIRCKVREFVLINSHVGETYHEHVARWPLAE